MSMDATRPLHGVTDGLYWRRGAVLLLLPGSSPRGGRSLGSSLGGGRRASGARPKACGRRPLPLALARAGQTAARSDSGSAAPLSEVPNGPIAGSA